MTRSKILFTAVLMGVALIGLVAMQVNWIRHDYKIQEDKFSQQVNGALASAVRKLETRESVSLIINNADDVYLDDSLRQFFKEPEFPEMPEAIPPFEVEVPVVPEVPVIPEHPKELQSYSFITEFDSGNTSHVKVITRHSGSGEKVSVQVISPDSIAFTELSANLKEQEKLLNQQKLAFKSHERAMKKHMELRKADMEKRKAEMEKQRLNKKAKQLNKVFEKMAVEYDMRTMDLMERVAPETLDSMIGSELKNCGVMLPYSMNIFSGADDSIIWKKNPPVTGKPEKIYTANLFPGDIINKNDLVKIGFSGTFSYFISEMWIMLMSSAIFTLAIIIIFSYTVYIIFRQKKLSDIKNDFINNMTHELKTPIATIRLASEAINNPGVIRDPEKVLHYTRIINDENTRMNDHVENILQMAQFDRKDFIRELKETDMHEVIRESIEKMQLQVAQKGGKIIFEPNAQLHSMPADRRYIAIVLSNLIDNAIKYNTSSPVIKITTVNTGNDLTISVSDNGIGMTTEQCRKVFEKFYRVTTGNLHAVKGFGLGLSYAKAIVLAHGGTISVTSEPGAGSRFDLHFRLTPYN